MTPRSPKQQPHPKSSTISRRLRNRADQSLSVQPAELPHLRGIRSHRAATLSSTNRHRSVNYPTEDTPTATTPWESLDSLDAFTRSSHTSYPQNPASGLLLSQPLHLPPYHSPQGSHSELVPISDPDPDIFKVQTTSGSDLLPSPLPSLSGSQTAGDFELRLSAEPNPSHDPSFELQDMSTLGFMMPPAQYSMDHYGSPPSLDSPSYPPMSQSYSDSKHSTSGPYPASYTTSPGMQSQHAQRRSNDHPVLPPYQQSSMPRSPYQQPLGSMRGSPTPISYPPSSGEPSPMISAPQSYPYPPIHANQPSTLGSNTSSYPPPPLYPPASYGMSEYSQLPTSMYPATTTPAPYPAYEHSPGLAPPGPGGMPGLGSSPNSQSVTPRILNSRPKPQCWEHGCNGRQFSTFSNLLRHQREKSGTAAKSYCPRCGAEFTRTTARNGHMAHEKCKPRRTSDSSR